jgi:DnaJ homolog subfamily C member 19
MMKLILFGVLLFVLYTLASKALSAPKPMAKGDAAKLLGVAADADIDAVIDAHRRLIAKVHPDAGGSAELAAQINLARDTLLKS